MRRQILEARLAKLIQRQEELKKRAEGSQSVDELRDIQTRLAEIADDIADTRNEIEALDAEKRNGFDPAKAMKTGTPENRGADDKYASLEYRLAFKAYVQAGISIPAEYRSGGDAGVTSTTELGAIIPTTVMNEFIKSASKVYGQVYSKVRKINIKGGVKFPISDLKAKFKWITESTVSPRQEAGNISDYVEFSYNIGEIRVAQTLLSSIVALDAFESEVVKIMTEAYVEMMDKVIINGTGNGQPLGIVNDQRVTNVVTMSGGDLSDWKKWRTKLFANVPLSKRGQGEFIFTASTVESYLLTMQDSVGRPIFREATELTVNDSNVAGRFFGREVTLVEPDVIADAGTASPGDVIGIYWVPSDYCINTQMQFGIKRYFDEDTNQWVNKALTVVDGKILDPAGCWLIKKGS